MNSYLSRSELQLILLYNTNDPCQVEKKNRHVSAYIIEIRTSKLRFFNPLQTNLTFWLQQILLVLSAFCTHGHRSATMPINVMVPIWKLRSTVHAREECCHWSKMGKVRLSVPTTKIFNCHHSLCQIDGIDMT